MTLLKTLVVAFSFQMTCTALAGELAIANPFLIAQSDVPPAPIQPGPDGKEIFMNECATCHRMEGEGVPGIYPPLAKADFLAKLTRGNERQQLISIIRKGLKGKITVNGAEYDGLMPAFGAFFGNAEIAAVLTYVTNEWGNAAEPFTEDEVKLAGAGALKRTENSSYSE